MFKGCATALITPFREDGEIDEEGLRELVRMQERAGVDALVPCGTTGESATLTHKEHLKVIGIVREEAKRAQVIAGAGSNATHEAIHLSKGAKDLGVDGVLLISPYYNKPNQKGIFRHYEAIAKAVDIPIVVYNVPSRTGSNIAASTVKRLSEVPNIVALKEASGNMAQINAILASVPEGFSVLSGDDLFTYPMMALGAKGVISVTSNVVPELMVEMTHAALEGDWARARALHFKLLPLFNDLFLDTNPIPVKTAMRMLKRPAGVFRLPLCDMEPATTETLRKTLVAMGLL
ncbi:MAG TPA: 4-hydroxy-tetrahydrodipicolinate synthase [Methanomassiliicoccales archaeon]|nr:4-hydroxy-tetrahydrodipicolinate synthase [Methanomassiliicoccales archaeon]HPD08574.1 4-hydroxy-tetrahydrodipicolinate synthase [Methanomassiliicoccales archaeon]HRU11692.1 4-hydroxy-tetrahydrodipicolinate synthase [Methanomassiliicoccales archaeon]